MASLAGKTEIFCQLIGKKSVCVSEKKPSAVCDTISRQLLPFFNNNVPSVVFLCLSQ